MRLTDRFTTLVAALTLAGLSPSLHGQSRPSMMIKQTPTSSWTSTPDPAVISHRMQFEITSDEGGWMHLMIDSFDTNSTAPAWVAEPNSTMTLTTLSTLTGITPYPTGTGSTQVVDVNEDVFRFAVENLGYKDLDGSAYKDNVTNWYVPILQNAGTRIWSAEPPIWLLSPKRDVQNQTYMNNSVAWWQSRTSGYTTGSINPLEFSPEALFKAGLLMREIADPNVPPGSADNYIETTYAQSIANGIPYDVSFRIQAVWMKSTTVTTPGTTPTNAPLLDLPPYVSIGPSMTIPLSLPAPSSTTVSALGLIGPVQPGEMKHFTLSNGQPPVILHFKTTTGVKAVNAVSSITLENPLRYRVEVPVNVLEGPIRVTDSRAYSPITVGEVTDVQN